MGGSVGKHLDPTTGFGLGGTAGRILGAGTTMGLSEFGQSNPFGVPIHNPFGGNIFGGKDNPYVSGPFSLDPNQLAADQSNIGATGQTEFDAANKLAQQQYEETTQKIPGQVATDIQLENPQIMESLNRNHVLDSSAYPQEIARQQALLTSQLQIPAEQQLQSQQQGALSGLQGFQTGGLQRGLSMEDMINQANISKSIGQTFAPQPPSGKQNFGTVAQGIGALSPWAKLFMGGSGGSK